MSRSPLLNGKGKLIEKKKKFCHQLKQVENVMDRGLSNRLRRWSDKKIGARQTQATHGNEAPASPSKDPIPQEGASPIKPEDLPPIESLTADSDFTAFLRSNVPSVLKKAALRKLWKSDPVLANVDGLNDYDENFAKMGLGKVVKTAYRVGKGMIKDKQEPATVDAEERTETTKNEEVTVKPENNTPESDVDEGVGQTEDTA